MSISRAGRDYATPPAPVFALPAIAGAPSARTATHQTYDCADTRALVALVDDAADLLRADGEAAFVEFAATGIQWRNGEHYVCSCLIPTATCWSIPIHRFGQKPVSPAYAVNFRVSDEIVMVSLRCT